MKNLKPTHAPQGSKNGDEHKRGSVNGVLGRIKGLTFRGHHEQCQVD